MPKILKMTVPATENASSTTAVVQHASRAVRKRSSGVLLGVIARNAGAAASGSTMTNKELAASRMYSGRLTAPRYFLALAANALFAAVAKFGPNAPTSVAIIVPVSPSTNTGHGIARTPYFTAMAAFQYWPS